MIAQYTCESHRMNHTYHTCIRIRTCMANQTCMVNQLKVGLDWLWSILWAKFVMKTNEKKKKKGARNFPFSNVFVFKRLNACTDRNIMFYAVVTYWPIIKGCPFALQVMPCLVNLGKKTISTCPHMMATWERLVFGTVPQIMKLN